MHQAYDHEQRTTEFTENREHERHITAESENTRKSLGQGREIHHLIQSMNEEHHSEEHSESQKDKRHYPFTAILWKYEIV